MFRKSLLAGCFSLIVLTALSSSAVAGDVAVDVPAMAPGAACVNCAPAVAVDVQVAAPMAYSGSCGVAQSCGVQAQGCGIRARTVTRTVTRTRLFGGRIFRRGIFGCH